MAEEKKIKYKCLRCGYEWEPTVYKDTPPRVCPRCKSPYWNRQPKLKMPESWIRKKKKIKWVQ